MSAETISRQVAIPAPAPVPAVRRGITLPVLGVMLLTIITLLLAVQVLRGANDRIDSLTLRTPYQAVLLNNGLAYFGKVENSNSRFLTLSDVYYVKSGANQSTEQKAQPNVLVKRGKEWHAPDRMTINIQDVVFIEPVAPESIVNKLIQESKQKGE